MVHSLQLLPGLGPKRQEVLREVGVASVEELVLWAPRDWIDRTRVTPMGSLELESDQLVRGTVASVQSVPGRRPRLQVVLRDESGTVDLLFFHFIQGWQRRLTIGSEWIASGKVSWYRGPQMVHPELEEVKRGEEWQGGILAVYPLTEKMRSARIEQRLLRRAMEVAFKLPALQLAETLPQTLRNELEFLPELDNYKRLHQPQSRNDIAAGLRQLRMGELLPVAIRMARRRVMMKQRGKAYLGGRPLLQKVEQTLPFQLTNGQQQAVETIVAGLEAAQQSHFLLQGDVGSGKTAVALLAAAAAIGAGVQVALMAPTEILIWQHFQKLLPLCKAAGIETALLTGATPPADRREILQATAIGRVQLLMGTHTLYSKDVRFQKLGLCIVDEQHRFGVGQRAALIAKGGDPDLLALSATPIPRSLAMTLYGDLQPVLLSEKPMGRQPILSRLVPQRKRNEMLQWLDKQFAQGVRAYWVVPRIEMEQELPQQELQSVEALWNELQQKRPHWKMRMVHGRLAEEEKREALQQFADGTIQLLVATTVIEVGVDVPQATVMVIEGADRFGLAQLHQLRGRVGRGNEQSWCFLLVDDPTTAQERLKGFTATEDGFAIAELDLQQRGAGNLEGLAQSGSTNFRWFDFVRDIEMIQLSADFAGKKMELWEQLPPDQKEYYLKWSEEDTLETAGNQ